MMECWLCNTNPAWDAIDMHMFWETHDATTMGITTSSLGGPVNGPLGISVVVVEYSAVSLS
jgi:hypothetical protein